MHGTSDFQLSVDRQDGDKVYPQWKNMFANPVVWPGGSIQWYFNPATFLQTSQAPKS